MVVKIEIFNDHDKEVLEGTTEVAQLTMVHLASVTDALLISSLIDIVFYQGMTMQWAVECDSENHSNDTMCMVNPSHISKTFSDTAL